MKLIASIITYSEKKKWKKKMLPSTLDIVPSPSTWNTRPSTLDKKIDSVIADASRHTSYRLLWGFNYLQRGINCGIRRCSSSEGSVSNFLAFIHFQQRPIDLLKRKSICVLADAIFSGANLDLFP